MIIYTKSIVKMDSALHTVQGNKLYTLLTNVISKWIKMHKTCYQTNYTYKLNHTQENTIFCMRTLFCYYSLCATNKNYILSNCNYNCNKVMVKTFHRTLLLVAKQNKPDIILWMIACYSVEWSKTLCWWR